MFIVLERWCVYCTVALVSLLYWSTGVFLVLEHWCTYCTRELVCLLY